MFGLARGAGCFRDLAFPRGCTCSVDPYSRQARGLGGIARRAIYVDAHFAHKPPIPHFKLKDAGAPAIATFDKRGALKFPDAIGVT